MKFRGRNTEVKFVEYRVLANLIKPEFQMIGFLVCLIFFAFVRKSVLTHILTLLFSKISWFYRKTKEVSWFFNYKEKYTCTVDSKFDSWHQHFFRCKYHSIILSMYFFCIKTYTILIVSMAFGVWMMSRLKSTL